MEGSEAIRQVSQLHGTDIRLESANIAEYAHSSPYHKARATIWVGRAESKDAAAELIRRMTEGIEKGGSGFSNLQRLTIADHEVFRVDGPGGEHFFYISRKTDSLVIWLTVEATDALSIMEQAIKNF